MPTSRRGGLTLAEERPRSSRSRIVGRVVILALVLGVGVAGYSGIRGAIDNFGGPRCQATALGNSVTFSPEQMDHAATIVAIAMKRGLPARAATIAVATAIQESKLRNLSFGDRDSVGLFQQRPSQGWGTREQILDPEYAANAFYDELIKIEGYQSMEITKVAQRVQKSAFPEAYADHEQQGRIIASAISGHSPGGLGCRLNDATSSDVATLRTALQHQVGVTGTTSGHTLVVRAGSDQQAWEVAAWAVAKADATGVTRVRVADRQWSRTRDKDGWSWQTGPSSGRTVTITLR